MEAGEPRIPFRHGGYKRRTMQTLEYTRKGDRRELQPRGDSYPMSCEMSAGGYLVWENVISLSYMISSGEE